MKKSDDSPTPDVGYNRFKEMRAGFGPINIIEGGRRGFVSHANYVPPVSRTVYSPSRTVPDMSLSLRDMLNRHLNGGAVKTFQSVNVPVGSRIPINLEMMDPFEKAELAERNADFIATTRGRMQTARAAREQAELLAKATAAAEARLASRSTGTTVTDV